MVDQQTIEKVKEQLRLADEFGFKEVYVTMPLATAKEFISHIDNQPGTTPPADPANAPMSVSGAERGIL